MTAKVRPMKCSRLFLAFAFLSASAAVAAQLEVGSNKKFERLEHALSQANPGDEIIVHAQPENKPYTETALLIRTPRLSIRAARSNGAPRVRLTGGDFIYSGIGSTPRAIVQFDPAAEGCLLEGFELSGARNQSDNGAGVRINGANNITIRDCEIHSNDMGIMSGGRPKEAANQRIENCLIRDNGSERDPGQNHNLYLGGTSVTLTGCEVRGSVTGHNVKSRAHYTRVEYSWIHDSANREFDLVDAKGATDLPGSHAVLLGNLISKANPCPGNRTVIHFGQDGGIDHNGIVHLIHNTIITPYIAPIVELSAPGARAHFLNNIIWNTNSTERHQVIARLTPAALSNGQNPAAELARRITGSHNWFSQSFANEKNSFPSGFAKWGVQTPFLSQEIGGLSDSRLPHPRPDFINAALPFSEIQIPPPPAASSAAPIKPFQQFKLPLGTAPRADHSRPALGAFSAVD